jgi:hypothetical protein
MGECRHYYHYYYVSTVPPLWSSGQSSWLQIQRSGFDSQRCQIFWEVVGLERGPLSLVITIEVLLERKSSGSCLEIWEYDRRDPSRWPRGTLYPQKLALTSPISSSRSVGIVRSQTQATEFLCLYGPLLDLGRFVSPLILYTVGRTPRTRDQPVAKLLPTHRHPYLEKNSNPRP